MFADTAFLLGEAEVALVYGIHVVLCVIDKSPMQLAIKTLCTLVNMALDIE